MTNTAPGALSDADRYNIVNAEVAKLARDGWTVSSVTPGQAVLQRRKRIGWFWNIILTLLTAGLWLIVVIVKLVNRKTLTKIVTVDAYGNVSTR